MENFCNIFEKKAVNEIVTVNENSMPLSNIKCPKRGPWRNGVKGFRF